MTIRSKRRVGVIGAGALAFATLSAGLTATAASAATTPAADTRQQVGPLVTQTSPFQGADAFSAPKADGAGRNISADRAATLEAAVGKAVDWYLPANGSVTPVRPVSDPDLCLTAGSRDIQNSSPVTLESCVDGNTAQLFSLAANTGSNNPIGTGLRSEYNGGFLGLYNTDSVMRLQTWTVADRVPTLDRFVTAFTAKVDGVDKPNRTAQLSGTGVPGATIRFGDKAPEVLVDGDGDWRATVGDLAIGRTTIDVTQHEGSEQTGQKTLTVDLDLAELTFDTRWATERDRPVEAFGEAEPGAEVKLFDDGGTQIGATVTADATTGEWSTTIPAPNAGGGYAVTAAQFIGGVRDSAGDVTRRVDYGSAVTITAPADGSAHPGGPLTLRGHGEPDSALTALDDTSGDEIGSGRVLDDGSWAIETRPLDRSEHVIRVEQRSKGANTTEFTVTVNPGESNKLAPITLTTPDQVTPGVTNTFTGTAEPGADFKVLNPWNVVLVDDLRVDAQGNWTFDRTISSGAKSFDFKIVQTKGDIGPEESEVFHLEANDGFAPIEVTTPTLRPGEVNTFEGTGPANATFVVLNASGNQIVPETVRIDPQGNWRFDRAVSAGVDRFQFKALVTVPGTAPYKTGLFTVYTNTR